MVSTTPLLGNILPGVSPLSADLLGGAGGGMQGGLLGSPWQYIADMGAGMLANSGPSFQPHSFASAMGAGFKNAGERQDQQVQNEYRRAAIRQQLLETQGQQGLQAWIAANPGKTPGIAELMRFMPGEAAKGMVAALTDPTLPDRQLTAAANADIARTKAEADAGELAQSKEQLVTTYGSVVKAADAADWLNTVPSGAQVATMSEDDLKLARKLYSSGADKGPIGDIFARYAIHIPRELWGRALNAGEQMQKARAGLANMTQQQANRAGVQGLQMRQQQWGDEAGLDLQSSLFHDAVDQTRARISAWKDIKLPEQDPSKYSWRVDAPREVASGGDIPPGGGFKAPAVAGGTTLPPTSGYAGNGQVNVQPATQPVANPRPISTPLPQPAAPPPAYVPPPAGKGLYDAVRSGAEAISNWWSPQAVPFNPNAPNYGGAQPPPTSVAPLPGPAPTTAGAGAPTTRTVKTVPIPVDPSTGREMKKYPGMTEGARNTPKGQKFIAPDPATGELAVWQN